MGGLRWVQQAPVVGCVVVDVVVDVATIGVEAVVFIVDVCADVARCLLCKRWRDRQPLLTAPFVVSSTFGVLYLMEGGTNILLFPLLYHPL